MLEILACLELSIIITHSREDVLDYLLDCRVLVAFLKSVCEKCIDRLAGMESCAPAVKPPW